MSGSRENEPVMTMRRPRAGIRLLVIQLGSMTQLLPTVMRDGASGRVSPRCSSSTQGCSRLRLTIRYSRRPPMTVPAGGAALSGGWFPALVLRQEREPLQDGGRRLFRCLVQFV
jgi:hypothetical protein